MEAISNNLENKTLTETIAERLKKLRTDYKYIGDDGRTHHLSHAVLSQKLSAIGADVSISTLKNYEVSKGSKAQSNLGMSVRTLCALAEFYKVSADYILGLSEAATLDTDIQIAQATLDLTNEAVTNILEVNSGRQRAGVGMNTLLSHKDMKELMCMTQDVIYKTKKHSPELKRTDVPESYKSELMDLINAKLYVASRAFEDMLEDIIKTEINRNAQSSKEADNAEEK